MAPTVNEQNDQPQEKHSGEGFIDNLNNLRGLKNLFGKKAATQAEETAAKAAGKIAAKTTIKAFFAATWEIWAIVVIVVLLFIIVFAIVSSGAAPGAPTMETNSPPNQIEAPTSTPTPPAEL